MITKLISAATSIGEPLTAATVRSHLRITSTADDTYINSLIKVAREMCEEITNRKFKTQTWEVYLNEWPDEDYITIPYAPLQSIASSSSSFNYTTSTGGTLYPDSTTWETDIISIPGRLMLSYGYSWPSETLTANNPIKIRFVCGHSSSTVALPSAIKHAMLLMIGHWWENREDTYTPGDVVPMTIPKNADWLLQQWRIPNC